MRMDKIPKLSKSYDDVFKGKLKDGILEEVNVPGEVGEVIHGTLPYSAFVRNVITVFFAMMADIEKA